MSEPAQTLCLAAAAQAVEAAQDLIELARHGAATGEIPARELVEKLADATRLSIEASTELLDPYDSERNQLHGALVKFLEGWAG